MNMKNTHKIFLVLLLALFSMTSAFADQRSEKLNSYDVRDYYEKTGTHTRRQTEFYASKSAQTNTFPLRVGDKLYIYVFREEDLTGFYTVGTNGKINFPLLGEVQAEGLTTDDLRKKLAEDLEKDYLVNPQLKVDFQEGNNSSVSILGEVNKPGSFGLSSQETLLKLVSEAGGFTKNAATTVKIMRRVEGGDKKAILVDVDRILKGIDQDVPLEPEDSIFVDTNGGEMFSRSAVSVLGQVAKPGNFEYAPGMTITKLVSAAQGFTRFADSSRVKINRTSIDGKKTTLQVNINAITDGRATDVALEEGDIVFVPESAF